MEGNCNLVLPGDGNSQSHVAIGLNLGFCAGFLHRNEVGKSRHALEKPDQKRILGLISIALFRRLFCPGRLDIGGPDLVEQGHQLLDGSDFGNLAAEGRKRLAFRRAQQSAETAENHFLPRGRIDVIFEN